MPIIDPEQYRRDFKRKQKELLKKQKEDKILEALEKQTDILLEIATAYRQRSQNEEKKLKVYCL